MADGTVNATADGAYANAREVFQEHHDEIQRRRQGTTDGVRCARSFVRAADDDGATMPFRDEDHAVVLYSLSHVGFAPRSRRPERPAVRILGTFATAEDARDHAAVVQAADPGASLLMGATHEWIVGAPTPEEFGDAAMAEATRTRILTHYATQNARNAKELRENVDAQRAGDVREVDPEEDDDADEGERSEGRACRLPARARKVDQKYAVLSVLPDPSETPPRFLFRVYQCVGAEAEANRYVRNVAGDEVHEHHIDVVSCHEWLFPQEMRGHGAMREVYRDEELDRIMATHKKQVGEVKRYREWRAETDGSVPPPSDAPSEGVVEIDHA